VIFFLSGLVCIVSFEHQRHATVILESLIHAEPCRLGSTSDRPHAAKNLTCCLYRGDSSLHSCLSFDSRGHLNLLSALTDWCKPLFEELGEDVVGQHP
jgi:hypothetical protein